MADPLSISAGVVGIAGFAIQLLQSVQQIKKFCKDVGDAPVELQETLDQLELTTKLLQSVNIEELAGSDEYAVSANTLTKSIDRCQTVLGRVSDLTSMLQSEMQQKHRKRRTSIKMVLKREDIASLFRKLESSKLELQFAYAVYSESRRSSVEAHMSSELLYLRKFVEEERKTQQLSVKTPTRMHNEFDLDKSSNAPDQTDTDNMTYEDLDNRWRKAAQRRNRFSNSSDWSKDIRISLPYWVSQYVWDLSILQASGSWMTTLRSFRVLPSHGGVLIMCLGGDVKGIQTLLQLKQLSVHDEFERQGTLFHEAARWGQTDLAQFLYDNGAVADFNEFQKLWYDEHFFDWGSAVNSASSQHVREHARFLIEHCEGDVPQAMQAVAKDCSQWTNEDRLLILRHVWIYTDTEQKFLDVMGGNHIDASLYHAHKKCEASMLHLIVERFSIDLANSSSVTFWVDLIKTAIKAGAELHALDSARKTPFMLLLDSCRRLQAADIPALAEAWCEILFDAGVDLQQYGQKELTQWNDGFWSGLRERAGVIAFTFDSKPSKCCLWQEHPGDLYADDFWNIVENPAPTIPGSWLDETPAVSTYEQEATISKRISKRTA